MILKFGSPPRVISTGAAMRSRPPLLDRILDRILGGVLDKVLDMILDKILNGVSNTKIGDCFEPKTLNIPA